MKPVSVDTPLLAGPGKSSIVSEPLGVIAILGSWNYPYLTAMCPLISAIAAGNAVVIKPSEMSPFSSQKIKQLIARNMDRESI
jgi:aldehyde dehydrogenase (NAD+)